MVWVVLLAITVLFGLGIPKVRLDTSVQSLIPTMDPDIVRYDRVIKEFGTDNVAAIYVRDSDLWTVEKIELLRELNKEFGNIESVRKVDSIFNYHSIESSDNGIRLERLIDSSMSNSNEVAFSRSKALKHPILNGNYISEDGLSFVFLLLIKEGVNDEGQSRLLYERLEEVIQKYGYGNFEKIFQLGDSRVRNDLESVFFRDIGVLAPLSGVVLIISLFFFLRSWVAPVIAIMTSGLCMVWTFGLMGWLGH